MKVAIKVTNSFGDSLYVCNVRKSWKLGFAVKIRKYAKMFSPDEARRVIKEISAKATREGLRCTFDIE